MPSSPESISQSRTTTRRQPSMSIPSLVRAAMLRTVTRSTGEFLLIDFPMHRPTQWILVTGQP